MICPHISFPGSARFAKFVKFVFSVRLWTRVACFAEASVCNQPDSRLGASANVNGVNSILPQNNRQITRVPLIRFRLKSRLLSDSVAVWFIVA